MFDQNEFKQSTASSLLATLMGVTIRILLATTTAGFFHAYAADVWTWLLPPTLAANAAALTGVVLIDGLAAGWTYARRATADTMEQQQFSAIGAMLDMSLSLVVTGAFVILSTPLLQASVSPQTYATLTNLAAWAGILIAVGAFAGNGILWHYYANSSSESQRQLQVNQLRAMALQAEHALDAERLKLWTEKTITGIRGQLPSRTAKAANRTMEEYLARRFAQLDTDNEGQLTEAERATLNPPPDLRRKWAEQQRKYAEANERKALEMEKAQGEDNPLLPSATEQPIHSLNGHG